MKGNLKQRLFAILLCIVMIGISVNITDVFNKKINAAASYISGSSGAKWEFTASSGTLKITHGGTIADFSSFSETPWASYKDDIKIVVMGYNQTNIPAHAFEGCTNLTKLQINVSSDGNSTCKMNSVGDYAFNGCTSLETITLADGSTAKRFNDGTTTIGDYAFNGCSKLTYFPFNTANASKSKLATIGNYGFYGTGITEVIIPESSKLNKVGTNAFPLNTSIRIKDSFTCGASSFDRIVNVFTYDVPAGYQINVNVTGEIYRNHEDCTSSNTFMMYGGDSTVDASTAKTSGTCIATITGSTTADGVLTTPIDKTYSYKNTGSSTKTQRIFFNVEHVAHPSNGATNSYDITLTASVEKQGNPYTIQFNANGGTGVPSSITKSGTDSSVVMGDIGSTVPTRSGYNFKGWSASSSWSSKRIVYISSNGGSTASDGTTATQTSSSWTYANYCSYTGGSTSGKTLTLYAQWEPIGYTYTIQFNANGGTGSVPSTITKTGTDSSVVMGDIGSSVPTRSGYIFRGWSASSTYSSSNRITYSGIGDATTTSSNWTYANYCSYTGGSTSSRTLTLYAQWQPAYTYTLNYNANGGSGAPSSQSVTNTSSTYGMTVSNTVPTRTGYTFSKWNTNSSGTGTNYTAGNSVSVGANASVTLYAQWTPNTNTPYKVNHYLMNTDGSTYSLKETESLTGTTAATLTLSNLKNTYDGFIYQGGKGTTAASATKPSSFDTTTTILADGTRVINLYYSRNQYTVTYIDVVDSQTGTQLGKSTGTAYYGTSVSGATKGTNTADNTYYKGYYYSSCTTATVGTAGATVYRIFKLRTIDINGSVNWNDKSNTYDSRPNDGDVTIYLYRNGELLKSTSTGLVENDNNTFSFTGLQKYNTATGEAYTYTVSQSEVISQNTPEDKYTTTVDSTGFNFTNTLGNADFHVEGSITWVDYENKYGTRPSEVMLNLYQNNKLFKTQVVDNNTTGYSFVNLDKYDSDLNSYTYMVEEVFIAKALTWDSTTKEWKEIDAYRIAVDGFDFTNTLVETENPIIEVKPDHINTLTIKLDFNDNIDWADIEKTSSEVTSFVTLKQMEMIMNEGIISYTSNYNGMDYKAIVNESGVSIGNIPSGKYEIVESNDNTFILEGIDLQTNNSMSVINENGKWYLIIAEVNENQIGTIILNMNVDSFNGYDDSMKANNLYEVGDNTSTAQVMMLSMFSDEVTVPEYVEPITYTITYKDCNVVDETKYSENSEATLKNCDIEGFLGWSEDSEAVEPQYLAGDIRTVDKDYVLYPVIEVIESTEIQEKETSEEEETESVEETTETVESSEEQEETSEAEEPTEDAEPETEVESSEEQETSETEETAEISNSEEETTEIESFEATESEEALEESSAFSE